MPEPRADMLPDVTDQERLAPVREDAKTPVPVAPVTVDEPVQPAEPKVKTPPNELLAALKEEREKRKEAERKLKELESSPAPSELSDEVMSDEGRALKLKYDSLEQKFAQLEQTREEERAFTQYPQLKDKQAEFDEFRNDYPGIATDKVARLFLSEKGLLETVPERRGLERPTAGDKTPTRQGISADEVDRLMKGDERKFIKMIRSGQIDPDKIV